VVQLNDGRDDHSPPAPKDAATASGSGIAMLRKIALGIGVPAIATSPVGG
jgi:hypothetical protein